MLLNNRGIYSHMNQTLYLMLGYPGSGKSHFSKQLAEKINAVRLNSDHLRKHLFEKPEEHHGPKDHLLVFGALAYAAHEALKAGHSVICDANYNFVKDRQKYAKIAQQFNVKTIVVWVKTPLEMAVERGAERTLTDEQIRLGAEHIKRVANELQPPCLPEETCIEIDGLMAFDRQFEQFTKQVTSSNKKVSL